MAKAESQGKNKFPEYQSRIILVACYREPHTALEIAELINSLVQPSEDDTPSLCGLLLVGSGFILLQAEGDHDDVIAFLRALQQHTARWQGLDPSHPLILTADRRRRAALAAGTVIPDPPVHSTAVLLFEEDISPFIRAWQVAFPRSFPNSGDSELAEAPLYRLTNEVVAATLKLTSAAALGLSSFASERFIGPFGALATQVVAKVSRDLPALEVLSRLAGSVGSEELCQPREDSAYPGDLPRLEIDLPAPAPHVGTDELKGQLSSLEELMGEPGTDWCPLAGVDELWALDELMEDLLMGQTVLPMSELLIDRFGEHWMLNNLRSGEVGVTFE
eukprot:gnl/Dysnectes_brevis/2911_a3565_653.p1 GENE.gnl/Dysnectes_brevis/2911_a3565_653~~gnl/Dysnectes_brevis/2911_a3565_653.p1  ORF type:complete len:371 (+),score=124.63 gnl/Dysnectes_brevis/2911_a3565_653:115-1113(+)